MRAAEQADPAPRCDASAAPSAPVAAVVALGGNLGDSRELLRAAVAQLAEIAGTRLSAVSSLWLTQAVGGPAQPAYLNAVAELRTDRTPQQLLAAAHAIEQRAARQRMERWGPRTLDLDIITYNAVISDDPALTLPHPRAHLRAFVLAPWSEIAPDQLLTAAGQTKSVAQWRETVADQQIDLRESAGWWR